MSAARGCELGGEPVVIDGRAVCHACGRTVPVRLTRDGLLVFALHSHKPRGGKG